MHASALSSFARKQRAADRSRTNGSWQPSSFITRSCAHSRRNAPTVPFMDAVFLLDAEARGRFLQRAACLLGCKYICLWSPLNQYPNPVNHLSSAGGWYQEEDSSRPSSSGLSLRLFESYRKSLCRSENGRVPGLAYQAGVPYFEMGASDLMNFASTQVQRQFYQEAGIKIAAFLGCASGEIELGMTKSSNMNMQANVQRVFGEGFVQQSQLRDIPNQLTYAADIFSPLSSPSSSRRSLSDHSPDSSSLLLTKPCALFKPDAPADRAFALPNETPTPLAHYRRYRSGHFRASTSEDDAVLAEAMLAVISSTAPASPKLPQQAQRGEMALHRRRAFGAAFKPYNSALALKVAAKTSCHGQGMIKTGIDLLRRISTSNAAEALVHDPRGPATSSNQLHHVMSERKRREKLNESFHALRMLLPPCSKKDKASVLSNTRNYLNALRDQITELEERNRVLETQLLPADVDVAEAQADHSSSSTESVQIHVSRSSVNAESKPEIINLRLTIREECDVIELMISLLECLQGMKDTVVVSLDASSGSAQTGTRLNLRLQVQGSDWDEESFREAVAGAVESVVEPRRRGTAADR